MGVSWNAIAFFDTIFCHDFLPHDFLPHDFHTTMQSDPLNRLISANLEIGCTMAYFQLMSPIHSIFSAGKKKTSIPYNSVLRQLGPNKRFPQMDNNSNITLQKNKYCANRKKKKNPEQALKGIHFGNMCASTSS